MLLIEANNGLWILCTETSQQLPEAFVRGTKELTKEQMRNLDEEADKEEADKEEADEDNADEVASLCGFLCGRAVLGRYYYTVSVDRCTHFRR
jgi:hypothetical protein